MKKLITNHASAVLLLAASALFASCSPQANNKTTSFINSAEIQNSNILNGDLADSSFQKEHGIVQLKIVSDVGVSTCTGSLIERDIVLTAAHCVDDQKINRVVAVFALDDITVSEDQVIDGIGAKIHPEYAPTDDTSKVWNDIAVIKLAKLAPSDFKLAILPTSETAQELVQDSKLILAGFGITNAVVREILKDKNGQAILGKDGQLQYVELPGQGSGTLRKVSDIIVTGVTEDKKEFTFNQENLRGACHGDSGGPALLKLKNGSIIQVGVTSRGTNLLGNCNEGAIYTGVTGHLDFIAKAVTDLNNLKNVPAAQDETAVNPN